jgi:hypothetical protein
MSQTSTIAKSIMTDRNAVYKASDVIEIFIPPEDVPLLNPAETYLKFLIQLKSTTAGLPVSVFAQPDDAAGAHSLISECQIFDGQNQQLLEQLDSWNNWTAKYFHYNASPGLRNIRTLMEGQSAVQGNALTSQYFTGNPIADPQYRVVEVCLPLHMSGILGSTRVFPVILTNGLRIRLTLAENATCLKAFVQQGFGTCSPTAASVGWVPTEAQSYERPEVSAPFAVGTALAVAAAGALVYDLAVAPTAAVVVAPLVPALNGALLSGANCPFLPGMTLQYLSTAGVVVTAGVITGVAAVAGKIQIAVNASAASVVTAVGRPIWCLAPVASMVEYQISQVELVASCVNVPAETLNQMRKKVNTGNVSLDFNTFNLYRSNLNARVPQPQILLPTTEHRALSVYQFPQTSSTSLVAKSFEPSKDGLLSYQYNIANRLTPNRRVDTNKVAAIGNIYKWDPVHMSELEKSLNRGKINVRALSLMGAQFGVGRELAKDGHSFNANDNEIRTQFVYSTAAADNTTEKLLHSYLYHTRTLTISPGSVAISY